MLHVMDKVAIQSLLYNSSIIASQSNISAVVYSSSVYRVLSIVLLHDHTKVLQFLEPI